MTDAPSEPVKARYVPFLAKDEGQESSKVIGPCETVKGRAQKPSGGDPEVVHLPLPLSLSPLPLFGRFLSARSLLWVDWAHDAGR